MDGSRRNQIIFELKRKTIHLVSFIYIFAYYFISRAFSHRTAILFLTFILIFLAFLEFVRIRLNKKIPFFHSLHREKENGRISSSIYLIMGVIIAFSAFQFEVAVSAILMMLFGDMAAALVGLGFGNHCINKSTSLAWEGIIAEFLVDVLIGLIFLKNVPVIFIMAFTATFIESILYSVDDNLAVPVVAGFAGQVTMMIMNILRLN